MLFTVLVISIMLTIALGISDITYKQSILSSTALDSQLAFYQADSGVECGMYYDVTQGQFPRGTTVDNAPNQLVCGNNTVSKDLTQSSTDYLVYTEDSTASNQACYSITFDKTTDPVKNTVSSRGYSTCGVSAQQVERGLSVTY